MLYVSWLFKPRFIGIMAALLRGADRASVRHAAPLGAMALMAPMVEQTLYGWRRQRAGGGNISAFRRLTRNDPGTLRP